MIVTVRQITTLTISLVVVVLVTACAKSNRVNQIAGQENLQSEQIAKQSLEIIDSEDSQVVHKSFSELGHFSDIVVIGVVVEVVDGYINTARNPSDISKPLSSLFNVGQVYKVKVEKYLKGNDVDMIFVVHRRGSIFLESGMAEISQVDVEQALANGQGSAPLQLGSKYLMFLASRAYDIQEFSKGSLYSGMEEPWRFIIDNQGSVKMESSIAERLAAVFPQKPLDEVLTEINTPFVFPASDNFQTPPVDLPYPYPGPVDSDMVEDNAKNNIELTPYP